jgi:hypothetical protein
MAATYQCCCFMYRIGACFNLPLSSRSEVVYKAKKTNSVTFQRFHCLTLDVGSGGATGTISLDTCLANYFAEEVSRLQLLANDVLTDL